MAETIERPAQITGTYLGNGEYSHGIFTAELTLHYGNGDYQATPGLNLNAPGGAAGRFIVAVLRAVGVDRWEHLDRKAVIALIENDLVVGLKTFPLEGVDQTVVRFDDAEAR